MQSVPVKAILNALNGNLYRMFNPPQESQTSKNGKKKEPVIIKVPVEHSQKML